MTNSLEPADIIWNPTYLLKWRAERWIIAFQKFLYNRQDGINCFEVERLYACWLWVRYGIGRSYLAVTGWLIKETNGGRAYALPGLLDPTDQLCFVIQENRSIERLDGLHTYVECRGGASQGQTTAYSYLPNGEWGGMEHTYSPDLSIDPCPIALIPYIVNLYLQ